MRLNLILPVVQPEMFDPPTQCRYSQCGSRKIHYRQTVSKALVDGKYTQVTARRYVCQRCGRTFRVYPAGVCKKQMSQRVIGLAVMLYVLGLSYGAVALVLAALGCPISKSSAYRAVQALAERVPGLQQERLLEAYRTPAIGADVTSVRCNGQWLTLGVCVDEINGLVLSIDQLAGEDTATLRAWLEPIIKHVDAQVVVTDDADAFKTIVDESGCAHQVCKSPVVRNTEALIDQLQASLQAGPEASLQALEITNAQAWADLERLRELIHTRQPQEQEELEQLYLKYAPAPKGRGKHSLAYRMRNLLLDRWNLWPRLTFYRTWTTDSQETILDGTNNATERCIGWWIKERYRAMHAYKAPRSALNLSRLLAFCGSHLETGVSLAALIA